jgi:hypothetical protein
MLSPKFICETLTISFHPLQCVPEHWDFGARIRMRIFGLDDEPLLTVPEVLTRHISTDASLTEFIADMRERVEEKGVKLDAWTLPQRQ